MFFQSVCLPTFANRYFLEAAIFGRHLPNKTLMSIESGSIQEDPTKPVTLERLQAYSNFTAASLQFFNPFVCLFVNAAPMLKTACCITKNPVQSNKPLRCYQEGSLNDVKTCSFWLIMVNLKSVAVVTGLTFFQSKKPKKVKMSQKRPGPKILIPMSSHRNSKRRSLYQRSELESLSESVLWSAEV